MELQFSSQGYILFRNSVHYGPEFGSGLFTNPSIRPFRLHTYTKIPKWKLSAPRIPVDVDLEMASQQLVVSIVISVVPGELQKQQMTIQSLLQKCLTLSSHLFLGFSLEVCSSPSPIACNFPFQEYFWLIKAFSQYKFLPQTNVQPPLKLGLDLKSSWFPIFVYNLAN